ncbi:MAG: response regulator transcription factor [Eubacterium sp.]
MKRKRILIADDDDAILSLISLVLNKEGFDTDTVSNGKDALESVSKNKYDLVILDIVMPLMFGTDAAKEIRQKTDCPIMFLTARSTDEDKLEAYGSGGDDYLQKPFSTIELLLRVKALLKRYESPTDGIEILKKERAVIVDGKKVSLTFKELELLSFLAENKGRVFDVSEIYEAVWHNKFMQSSTNTVMVFILNLRKKIEQDYTNPRHILTVWGRGYCYED